MVFELFTSMAEGNWNVWLFFIITIPFGYVYLYYMRLKGKSSLKPLKEIDVIMQTLIFSTLFFLSTFIPVYIIASVILEGVFFMDILETKILFYLIVIGSLFLEIYLISLILSVFEAGLKKHEAYFLDKLFYHIFLNINPKNSGISTTIAFLWTFLAMALPIKYGLIGTAIYIIVFSMFVSMFFVRAAVWFSKVSYGVEVKIEKKIIEENQKNGS